MKNTKQAVSVAVFAALLAGCGSSSSDNNDNQSNTEELDSGNNTEAGQLNGPFATGSASEPEYVYIDLATGEKLNLTAEQAVNNSEWDIALTRHQVFLNQHADNTVGAYHTGNNADFYDDDAPIVERFINATADSELDDFTAVTAGQIPADEQFLYDSQDFIIDNWSAYDMATHSVSAQPNNYFIAKIFDDSGNAQYSKFSVTQLSQNGFVMADITLTVANQASDDTLFATPEDRVLDFSQCSEGNSVYVDLLSGQSELTQTGSAQIDYSLVIPCGDGGAQFSINLADEVTAVQDFDNAFTGIDPAFAMHMGFESNEFTTKAFETFVTNYDWAEYGINGEMKMWSQFGVYIIKADNTHYKLQFISYYDDDGSSGAITLRSAEIAQ